MGPPFLALFFGCPALGDFSPDVAPDVGSDMIYGNITSTKHHQISSHSPSHLFGDYSIYILSKEVGKQSSELRMTFTWNNTLNEGLCETWHHIWIRSMKGGVRLWRETWHHITIHYNTLNKGWCETVVRDFTSHKNTLNEEWCETVVWDLTSHKNTLV